MPWISSEHRTIKRKRDKDKQEERGREREREGGARRSHDADHSTKSVYNLKKPLKTPQSYPVQPYITLSRV